MSHTTFFSGIRLTLITAALVVAMLSVFTSQLHTYLIDKNRQDLENINFQVDYELHRQVNNMILDAKEILSEDIITQAITDVFKQASPQKTFHLRQLLAPSIFTQHYSGFYLIDLNSRIIASMKDSDKAIPLPLTAQNVLTRLEHGEQMVVSHPFQFRNKITMWLIQKVRDKHNKTLGYLALRGGKQHRFTTTTGITGTSGRTTETYIIDKQGYLLSESRFNQHLVGKNMLKPNMPSSLHIRAITPQGKTHTNTPDYTLAARNLIQHQQSGYSTDSYFNYLGNEVIGVWHWDKILNAGIITETSLSEALETYTKIRSIVFLLAILILLTAGLAAYKYSDIRTKLERESNKHRNLLLESTAEAIYGIDLQGNCTFVNKSFLKLLGYEEQEVVGKNIHHLIHHSYPDKSPYASDACNVYKAFKENVEIHCDSECFWHKDGHSIAIEYWSHPVVEDGITTGCVVTFLDISDKLQAISERTQMERKVQHSQRLESLGVLAGGIAHDFNNLLATIMGNASLAESNILKEPLKAKAYITNILSASERAGVLCKQMLAYSGKGRFIVKPINMTHIVEEMTHLLEVSLEKSVVLKYHLTQDLPLVMVDEAQVQQVIMNLVTNASEAIEGKSGIISISTGLMHADEAYLEGCYKDKAQPKRYVYVEVSDTGCGMDKDIIDKVFDPFFTTKMTGRGLGMSAVLGIVRGHNGALKIYSELGRGTTFKFLLPIDESNLTTSFEEYTIEPLNDIQGKALVVDDEETVREMSCMMLEGMGVESIPAADGKEALQIYKERADEISFVFTDLTMPQMGGKELYSQLKMLNPDCPIILCSGYNSQEAIQQFAGKGLAGFVQKPFTSQELQREINKVLRGIV